MKNSRTKQSYLTYICIVFSSLLALLLLYFVVRNDASMFNKNVHGINSIVGKTDSFVLNPSAVAFLPNNLNENLGYDAIHFSRDISTPALSEIDLGGNDTHNLVVCNNNREGSNTSENLHRTFLLQKKISKEFVDKSDINHKEVSQVLKGIRTKNINRVIIGHFNVNFFAAKLDAIKTIIPGKMEIIVFSETKLDASYPMTQLLSDGYCKPFRLDRNAFGGGILIYVRSDIPCKQVNKHEFSENIEGNFCRNKFPQIKMASIWHLSPTKSK